MKKMAFLLMAMMGFGFMAQAQTDSLQQYTGKFTFPEGGIVSYVTISVDGGKLVFSSDKGSGSLEKVSLTILLPFQNIKARVNLYAMQTKPLQVLS